MGMFDYINCKYPLPVVDLSDTTLEQKDLAQDCQTKGLENILRNYTIEEDGRISYIEYKNSKWIEGDPQAESFMGRLGHIEQSDPETLYLTGNRVIQFGNFLTDDNGVYDYSWDWEATVIDGKVQSIRLVEFEKFCNKQRKENLKKIDELSEKRRKFQSTFYYKYFYKYVLAAKNFLRYKTIKFLHFIINLLYKI